MKLKLSTSALSKLKFSYGERLQPTRDWYILLMVAGVLLGLSVGWNLWIFAKITSGETIGNATPPPEIEQDQLERTRILFEKRAAEQQRFLHEYQFVDPARSAGSVKAPEVVATTTGTTTPP